MATVELPYYNERMAVEDANARSVCNAESGRRGRPYGQKYGRATVVRLPVEAEAALDQARALHGVSVSEIVRESIMLALPRVVERAAELARNEKRAAAKRLRAVALIDECAKAALALSPDGAAILAPLRAHHEAVEHRKAAAREAAKVERQRIKRQALARAAVVLPRRPSWLPE